MIEPIEAPEGVIAFRAVGEVHSGDYESVLRPAVAAARERGPVRLVYVLGPEFEGYSAGASLQDAKLGLDHPRSWERIALVTSHDWVRRGLEAFAWIIPGKVETFELDQLEAALGWAAADD